MYLIKRSKNFKRSYKKLKRSGVKKSVFEDLKYVIKILVSGDKLPIIYKDHALEGEYLGYRDCHIKGDLILIYKIEKDILILVLADIGSHSELF